MGDLGESVRVRSRHVGAAVGMQQSGLTLPAQIRETADDCENSLVLRFELLQSLEQTRTRYVVAPQ